MANELAFGELRANVVTASAVVYAAWGTAWAVQRQNQQNLGGVVSLSAEKLAREGILLSGTSPMIMTFTQTTCGDEAGGE